jgi:hypothetical protein
METEGSLPCSQKPTTSPYHEPHQSSAQISSFLTTILILSSHLGLEFWSVNEWQQN